MSDPTQPDPTASPLILKLTGSRIDKPDVPALLRAGAARSTRPVADPFLPDDYVRVVDAFDLSPGGRSAPKAQKEVELQVKPGQLLVLELPDGTTLITSGGRLEDELQRVAPEAVGRGAVGLDDVLPRGAASRGLLDSLAGWCRRCSCLTAAAWSTRSSTRRWTRCESSPAKRWPISCATAPTGASTTLPRER